VQGVSAEEFNIENIGGTNWLVGDFVLQSKDAITNYKEASRLGNKVYISAGYWRDAEEAGQETVDFKNIEINHFAIGVHMPRAEGASLDESDGAVLIGETHNNKGDLEIMFKNKLPKFSTPGFSLDEASIEYEKESLSAVDKMIQREEKALSEIQRLNTDLADQKKSFDEASGANEALKIQIKDLKEKLDKSISMDELDTHVQELTEVKTRAAKLGIDTEFKTVEEGKKIIVDSVYGKSFDSALVDGAYSTLPNDDEYNKQKINSEKKLAGMNNSAGMSMDSANKTIAQMSVEEVKAKIRGDK